MNRFKHVGAAVCVVGVLGILGIGSGGCLDRDVVSRPPSTNTTFTTTVHNQTIDKVDILFMIDNSPSMGDKQSLLALAVPQMINRLVTPNCLDASGAVQGKADQSGNCPAGQKAEFTAVHDMHIGIVSSSLGSRGGDVCPDNTPNPVNGSVLAHDNDNGELINRGGVAGDPTVENTPGTPDAPSPLNFLSYFPKVTANGGKPPPPTPAITDVPTLVSDFTTLIEGVHEHGCGFESQNEAWYRFLIQPDPFATVTVTNDHAVLSGIDNVILKQRADFLRPDSLVAIIVVTDENEEADDPLTIGGQGWAFDKNTFPGSQTNGGSPQGTIECYNLDPNNPTKTGPNDPNCTSCAFLKTSDPSFATRCPATLSSLGAPYASFAGNAGYLNTANDAINLRFFHQKERFGLFSGYPTSRYIRGLQKTTVPSVGLAFKGDTDHEHDGNGNYIGDQDPQANCVNPLYATNLPTSSSSNLCQLTNGGRTPDLVYYAAIAGVPHQLLQQDPTNAMSPQKDTLADSDWLLITGKDPEHYDFSGADFHMVESPLPRSKNTGNWANTAKCTPAKGVRPSATTDPINGCEYDTTTGTSTGGVEDLEFSCIFPLVQLTGGKIQPFAKDCTKAQFTGACDCAAGSLDSQTQLCDPKTPTTQIYAKAYPSVREMVIAHAMSTEVINGAVSNQGIVSSLCPIALDVGQDLTTAQNDPLFGYNPAVNAIINRLKASLSNQCVPEKLSPNPADGTVQCLILVTLPGGSGTCNNPGSACTGTPGLIGPSTDPTKPFQQAVLDKFCADQEAAFVASKGTPGSASDPAKQPVCAMQQVVVDPSDTKSCATGSSPGWCYVQGAGAQQLGCPAGTIVFTSGMPPHGATTSLQCLESSVNVIDAGSGGGGGGGG